MLLATLSILIGVEPQQFVLLVIAVRVLESLQHANLRLRFPFPLERVAEGMDLVNEVRDGVLKAMVVLD